MPDLAKLHDIRINNNLADVYILEGDFKRGRHCWTVRYPLLLFIIINEKSSGIVWLRFLFEKQQKLEEAVFYYKQAIDLARSYGDKPITKSDALTVKCIVSIGLAR